MSEETPEPTPEQTPELTPGQLRVQPALAARRRGKENRYAALLRERGWACYPPEDKAVHVRIAPDYDRHPSIEPAAGGMPAVVHIREWL